MLCMYTKILIISQLFSFTDRDFFRFCFRFVMGIEFRESSLVIGPKTQAKALRSQIFNLNVGLSGLSNSEAKEKEGKTYALFVGDTVCVNEVH